MRAEPPAGFPPRHRLRKRREFLSVATSTHRYDTRYLRALASLDMDPAAHARLGITVTKRVGNAVVRNRIKRHVREAFRNAAWPDGVALVFIATGAAANADGRALCEAVDTIRARLAKARLSHTLRNAEPTLSEKSNSSGTSGQAP